MSEVIIIDSGGANLASLVHAFERLGARAWVSANPSTIASAPRVILPGVGAAGMTMQRLRDLGLLNTIRSLQCPLLGICLGMQLLFDRSDENDTETLGLLRGRARRFDSVIDRPVPHMGWNTLRVTQQHPLLEDLGTDRWVYFVHSYHLPADTPDVIATSEYGQSFAAIVNRGPLYGVQFHPERSATTGALVLRNFLHVA